MFGGNKEYRDHAELRHLSGVFDLLPLLPRARPRSARERRRTAICGRRPHAAARDAGARGRGEPATREHVRHILATTLDATRGALRRKFRYSATARNSA
jgi:hypothetical protein